MKPTKTQESGSPSARGRIRPLADDEPSLDSGATNRYSISLMKVAIPKETRRDEKRVAATPETIKKLIAAGLTVSVESGAGEASVISDAEYQQAGASIAANTETLFKDADIILKVQRPTLEASAPELDSIKEGAILIGLLQPLIDSALVAELSKRKIIALSMDAIPRIARAQKMDALSSQSNVAGYKAVIMAADHLTKMMPLMMTAAGTISPAKVLVIGAGVAGLQAIATAKRLGAVIEAFDTRPVVKDQVESLGAKFIEVEAATETEDKGGYAKELSKDDQAKQLELIAKHAAHSDIIVTTAQIPGRPSPVLITEETVQKMKPGSVIVDLAVEGGGNCAISEKGKNVVKHGVTLIGQLNVPSLMANQASQLYARNIIHFLFEFYVDQKINLDMENDVIKGSLITQDGNVVHEGAKSALEKKGLSV